MNKRKIAILVEGQAEYIFVRDFLCCWYEYDATKMGLECYAFRSEQTHEVPYSFGSRNSETFYQIYNVGNDRSVLSKMLKEAPRLKNVGFQRIVGLSDMFSDAYHQIARNRCISKKINEQFIQAHQEVLANSEQSDVLCYHFAIMEVEAWFLGMYPYLRRIDIRLSPQLIFTSLGIDVTQDPETTFYHPAVILDKIYRLAGKHYGKHDDDVCRILSILKKQDYRMLLDSGKCNSFKEFVKDIVNEEP